MSKNMNLKAALEAAANDDTLDGRARRLMEGAYDLHTHTTPSAFSRALNDLDLVREAEAFGMAGVMIKAHYGCTSARAALVNLISGCRCQAYGGLALNWPTGGLNPYSVENALKTGGTIIWMPTRDSKNCLAYGDMPGDFFRRPGISILDGDGRLLPQVREIMDIVKRYGAWLATGHLSAEESLILCREGRKEGVNMILTHPEWNRTKIAGSIQADLAAMGVLIEKNWLNLAEASVTPEEMAENIRLAGPEHVYLATDRGQSGAEHPAEALFRFIKLLLWMEFSDEDLSLMVKKVPERIAL